MHQFLSDNKGIETQTVSRLDFLSNNYVTFLYEWPDIVNEAHKIAFKL